MQARAWFLLGLLMSFSVVPVKTPAQTVKPADLIGAWRAEVEYPGHTAKATVGLVLWPDGLWLYTGSFLTQNHGGARWRLVGDTLWLANDYAPYFHPIAQPRLRRMLDAHGRLEPRDMDLDIINGTPLAPVPDSVYWSPAFRDTTSACAGPDNHPCAMWVYRVSKRQQQLHLVAVERLSKVTQFKAAKGKLDATLTFDDLKSGQPIASLWVLQHMATAGVFTRDSLMDGASLGNLKETLGVGTMLRR